MERQQMKRFVPAPVWRTGSNLYWWWYNRGRHVLARSLSAGWNENARRLAAYRDRYAGRRCFIVGNGPSLRQTDLSRLKGEVSFGLNRIYLAFNELGFRSTFLVAVNDLVLEQCSGDIAAIQLPRFVTWRVRRLFRPAPDLLFIDSDYTGTENFSGDATGRIFEGFTVTYVALQIAFFMGFSEAILIGVDHNFVTKGPANSKVVSQGDDPNHFSTAYFGKGFIWQLPDLDGSERAYRLARQAYEAAGRRVVDATVGGKLTVFPKVDYLSLFG